MFKHYVLLFICQLYLFFLIKATIVLKPFLGDMDDKNIWTDILVFHVY